MAGYDPVKLAVEQSNPAKMIKHLSEATKSWFITKGYIVRKGDEIEITPAGLEYLEHIFLSSRGRSKRRFGGDL